MPPANATARSRARGTLLGLACGDALGRPVEFVSADRIAAEHGRVTEMLGHGSHGQPAGTVTDDTDLALALARSLVASGGFDPTDAADRYVSWLDSGPFDVGLMTRDAIDALRTTAWDAAAREVWERRPEGSNAGNGSLMCCAPVGLAFDGEALETASRAASALTHYDPRCRDACVVLDRTVSALVDGADAAEALSAADVPVNDDVVAARDGVRERDPATLSNSGYVVDTLAAGLHHGLTAPDAETAIADAVSMGGDADTVGAVTGAVAGARFGVDALPNRWLDALDPSVREELSSLAADLHAGDFELGPAADWSPE